MGQMAVPCSLENFMFHLLRTRITRPYRASVALEEERVWVDFYRRVDNPAIAAEVIQHLDADADQKRAHPALYLRCKESLRKKKARQGRTKRIRRFVRRILGLLRHSESNLRPQLRHSARITVEGLSEAIREPTHPTVKSRPQTAEVVTAQPDCGGQPNPPRPSPLRLDARATAPRSADAA